MYLGWEALKSSQDTLLKRSEISKNKNFNKNKNNFKNYTKLK